MDPARRVAPEKAPLVVAPRSFEATKPHSSRPKLALSQAQQRQ